MLTKETIKIVNCNDISFLLGKPLKEVKRFFVPPHNIKDFNNGMYKITTKDELPIDGFKVNVRSNSDLDGEDMISLVIDTYNNGITLDRLHKYSETKAFVKALRFTGTHTILNDILNEKQLRFLEEIWLYKNAYGRRRLSDNCLKFIENNDWAKEYLLAKGIVI